MSFSPGGTPVLTSCSIVNPSGTVDPEEPFTLEIEGEISNQSIEEAIADVALIVNNSLPAEFTVGPIPPEGSRTFTAQVDYGRPTGVSGLNEGTNTVSLALGAQSVDCGTFTIGTTDGDSGGDNGDVPGDVGPIDIIRDHPLEVGAVVGLAGLAYTQPWRDY